MTTERGPYMSEEGPDFWLPTDSWAWNEARGEAARHASDEADGISRYLGKVTAHLHDHDDWEGRVCCEREAYHFTIVDKPWAHPCECGCGQPVRISTRTGHPNRFIVAHNKIAAARPAHERVLDRIFQTEGGCWTYAGPKNYAGYGQTKVANRSASAHRVVYEALVGPIPEGREIDHLCRNRACVNPDHLEVVTHQENLVRGASARRLEAQP